MSKVERTGFEGKKRIRKSLPIKHEEIQRWRSNKNESEYKETEDDSIVGSLQDKQDNEIIPVSFKLNP